MGKQWRQWLTIFLGSKITADGDCSHEIKRRLLLGRKVMTNPRQHIKKQRQQARAPLQFLPDEARSLPPPKLTDPRLAFVGFLGYCSGLIDLITRSGGGQCCRPVCIASFYILLPLFLLDIIF